MTREARPAIVIGAHINALGVIRSLAQIKVPIVVVHFNTNDFTYCSRYVSKHYRVPDPKKNEKAFVAALLKIGKDWPGGILMPTNDESVMALVRNRARLEKHFRVAAPSLKHAQLFIEKENTYRLCDRIGVPCPKTYTPRTLAALRKFRKKIMLPAIIKPVTSHDFVADFNTKLFRVNTWEELERDFKRSRARGHLVMVQEWIPGGDEQISDEYVYYDRRGKERVMAPYAKVRLNPPQEGVTRVGYTNPHKPPLVKSMRRLMRAVKYKGLAAANFKHDHRDGKYKLIEVNVRFIRPIALFTKAGVNIPELVYRDYNDEKISTVQKRTLGVYWIEIYADLINFLLRDRGMPWTLKEYIKPYREKNKVFALWDTDDKKPFIWMLFGLPRKYWFMFTDCLRRLGR